MSVYKCIGVMFYCKMCHTLKRRYNTLVAMHMSSFGLIKGHVSLSSRQNWLGLKRNETKVHWESNFLLSLWLQVVFREAGHLCIYNNITNLPFIKTKIRHMHTCIYSRNVTSFQCVANLAKKVCQSNWHFEQFVGKQRRLWSKCFIVFLKPNHWGLIV